MVTTKEKFDAAVDVVQSLPKEGPIQPSNDTRLKFYGYYKQATEGKCNRDQPYFWDVVNRAKWDAWSKLGDMSADEAMNQYVIEFKKMMDNSSTEGADPDLIKKIDYFMSIA